MKPKSNASNPQPFVRIDVDKLLDAYTRIESALTKIANYSPTESPQMQAIRMRQIAKEALNL